MSGVRAWLPLPLWLVALMFVGGVGAGVGMALMVTARVDSPPSAPAPWKDQQAGVLPAEPEAKPADEPVPENPPVPEPVAGDVVPALPPDARPAPKQAPPAKDERRLANMISSPVRRALENALERLEPKITECRGELPGLPQGFDLRLSLESVGGMATVTEVEAYEADAVAIQECLLKKTSQILVDFPVEDGIFDVIHRIGTR